MTDCSVFSDNMVDPTRLSPFQLSPGTPKLMPHGKLLQFTKSSSSSVKLVDDTYMTIDESWLLLQVGQL